ncbi:unnamed protein product [Allacma fusca]|uniref:Uncharacterized protein n=1 Tax=Allacma fusca TaxID=39272 RepID=A0A8J2L495_9HEXA|nr:unnamed protein product [Allacma fusca]
MSESHTDTKAVSGSIDSSKIIDLTDLYVSESKAEQAHQHNLLAAKKSDASKSVRRESPVKVVIEGKLRTIPQERSSSAIFRDMRIISGAALTFSAKNPDDSVHVGHRRLTKVPATSKSLMQMVHDSITTDSKHHSYDSGSVDHMNAASIASCNLQASSIPPEIR